MIIRITFYLSNIFLSRSSNPPREKVVTIFTGLWGRWGREEFRVIAGATVEQK